jgi:predicted nucleotidyltransferase
MILSQKEIENVVNTIVREYKPEKVLLFGSYQKNIPRDESDLDLLIIKKINSRKFERSGEVKKLFNPYPCAMDIIVFTPDEFEKSRKVLNTLAYFVDQEHKVMYDKAKERRRNFINLIAKNSAALRVS